MVKILYISILLFPAISSADTNSIITKTEASFFSEYRSTFLETGEKFENLANNEESEEDRHLYLNIAKLSNKLAELNNKKIKATSEIELVKLILIEIETLMELIKKIDQTSSTKPKGMLRLLDSLSKDIERLTHSILSKQPEKGKELNEALQHFVQKHKKNKQTAAQDSNILLEPLDKLSAKRIKSRKNLLRTGKIADIVGAFTIGTAFYQGDPAMLMIGFALLIGNGILCSDAFLPLKPKK